MTTAKSCCFIQDRNIDINNKTAKRKATGIFPIFWTNKPSFSRGFNEESENRLPDSSLNPLKKNCLSVENISQNIFSLLFCYLVINMFSLSFLNFNFKIAGQKVEGIQKHSQIASCKFSPIESHFHQVYC